MTDRPYVRAIKPHTEHTLGSYLVFLSVFGVVSALVYSVGFGVVAVLGWEYLLFNWALAIIFIAGVFMPAFLGATAAVRVPIMPQGIPE
ncbi:hypothetical protein [Roseibium sp.]|uniref:hypothetical protein n=1 Tax=Roseibium sp. TaxID=1936156 RepID=UPI0039EEA203